MSSPDDSSAGLGATYRDLNERFYSARPADYLRTRWMLLGLVAGNRGGVEELFAKGTSFAGINFVPVGTESASQHAEDVAYLVTESEALLHHASETLLRLFFAHLSQPACPWVEIAALRRPRDFKSRAEQLLDTSTASLNEAAGHMFTGDAHGDAAASHGPAMARVLRAAAKQVIDRARVYNSVKHGMAVIAGESSLWFVAENGPEGRAGGQGPSVTVLDSERLDGRGRLWSEHTEWVDVRANLLLTNLMIMGIEAIWHIAAASYADAPLHDVRLPTDSDVDAVLLSSGRGHPLVSMRLSLFEELP